jgi:hypothetical protein
LPDRYRHSETASARNPADRPSLQNQRAVPMVQLTSGLRHWFSSMKSWIFPDVQSERRH